MDQSSTPLDSGWEAMINRQISRSIECLGPSQWQEILFFEFRDSGTWLSTYFRAHIPKYSRRRSTLIEWSTQHSSCTSCQKLGLQLANWCYHCFMGPNGSIHWDGFAASHEWGDDSSPSRGDWIRILSSDDNKWWRSKRSTSSLVTNKVTLFSMNVLDDCCQRRSRCQVWVRCCGVVCVGQKKYRRTASIASLSRLKLLTCYSWTNAPYHMELWPSQEAHP